MESNMFKEDNKKVMVGIVLYNPILGRLRENIESIYKNVDKLAVVDNASENNLEIMELLKQYDKIEYIRNNCNMGIAKALNQICELAEKNCFSFVMTLDQDSVCLPCIIEEYAKYIRLNNLGILCPLIKDRNYEFEETNIDYNDEISIVNSCITSGMLFSVSVWKSVNGFDEVMFIDKVDFDFCGRIQLLGYKIYRVNKVLLLHEVGNSEVKYFMFLHKVIVRNHSAFRKYYIARNTVFLARKRRTHLIDAYIQVLKQLLLVLFYERKKVDKIIAISKGVYDGVFLEIDKRWQY